MINSWNDLLNFLNRLDLLDETLTLEREWIDQTEAAVILSTMDYVQPILFISPEDQTLVCSMTYNFDSDFKRPSEDETYTIMTHFPVEEWRMMQMVQDYLDQLVDDEETFKQERFNNLHYDDYDEEEGDEDNYYYDEGECFKYSDYYD